MRQGIVMHEKTHVRKGKFTVFVRFFQKKFNIPLRKRQTKIVFFAKMKSLKVLDLFISNCRKSSKIDCLKSI